MALNLAQYPPVALIIPEHYYKPQLSSLKDLPLVSVVTPSLNHEEYVEQTIKSVIQQSYPEIEYIIQDGASTDGTVRIIEQYRSKIAHVESIDDSGQANAINQGFAKSRGSILAWLNSDDCFLPGALDYVVNYFLAHSDVDVVYGHRILIDANGNEVGRWVLPPHSEKMLRWADYVPQETLFWRREIWDKVGAQLDESFKYAMDWDLLLRFQEAGAKMVRLSRFLGAFCVHEQQKTTAHETVGQHEMVHLRRRYHGRPVSKFEVYLNLFAYRVRLRLFRTLFRWRFLRY